MKKSLEGKVGLVTRGGSGIGRATALAFIRAGAKVVVSDVDVEGGQETVQQIEEEGGEAIFLAADVSKASDVERLIAETVGRCHRLDCAVNNAAVEGFLAPLADYTEKEWDFVINTNLKGVWLCMKHQIPRMIDQGGGSIVNISSIYGQVGARNMPAYAASKHGVVGLTKSAALEYAQAGVRVNAVCPSLIRTPMVERVVEGNPELEAALISKHPMGRMGTPEEVAEAALWMCSDAAAFVTGHIMSVDGGRVAE